MSQFDMFADEPVQLTPEQKLAIAAEEWSTPPVLRAPAKIVVEYPPLVPYEPKPENASALVGWTMRTQRRNLKDLLSALDRVTDDTRVFFSSMARETLFKLDGIGSDW